MFIIGALAIYLGYELIKTRMKLKTIADGVLHIIDHSMKQDSAISYLMNQVEELKETIEEMEDNVKSLQDIAS